jgi:hypothetical protein
VSDQVNITSHLSHPILIPTTSKKSLFFCLRLIHEKGTEMIYVDGRLDLQEAGGAVNPAAEVAGH